MKAYCINLDRRPDRLAHMTAEFAKAGIPFERIPAVDGQDPEVAAAAARLPAYINNQPISAGAHGCFESHRAAWRRLVESGAHCAMVFEDDLVLAPGMAIYQSEDWFPVDADIVKLETYGVRVQLAAGRKMARGDRFLHPMISFHHGTGAYVISADAARRLLAETRPVGLPVDRAMFDETSPMRKGRIIYQMVPAPAIQGDRRMGGGGAEWEQTSLAKRVIRPAGAPKEPLLRALRKKLRLRQRLRGFIHRTRYVVVPHG